MGGKGRRLGGEKAKIKVCGKKLIEIAIEKFSRWDLIFVCRDEEQAKMYAEYGCRFVCDTYKNFGVLAGIHAALKHFEACIVTAVDMPFVKPKLAEFLYQKGIEMGCDALVPKHRYAEPLLAFYSRTLLEEIERSIKRGERRIIDPLMRANTIFYPADELRKFDKNLVSFFNINTPEDLIRAERLCSEIATDES